MTLEEVNNRIQDIKDCGWDYEVAHSEEDKLREDVLIAIAYGSDISQELARLVLTTSKLDFPRYCA